MNKGNRAQDTALLVRASAPPREISLALIWRFGLFCLITAVSLAAPSAAQDDVIPSRPAPRWWKGNLHTHTLWSDGDDFPEMVAEWYRTHDYNFLALSDHN